MRSRAAPLTLPVSSATGTGARRARVRRCCCASTSVGASRAAWAPASTARSMASSATSVLPDPTSPCSSRSIRRGAARLGVDLGQRRRLRRRERVPERRQRPRPQAPVADQRPARPCPHPPSHQRQRHLPGQQLVIGEPPPRAGRRRRLRRVQGAQRLGETRPALAPQQRRVVPFRQFGDAGERLGDRAAQMPGEQAGGERPDRLHVGQPLGVRFRHDMLGVDETAPLIGLAGDHDARAHRQFAVRKATEEGDLGETGAVRHHRAGRLARVGRAVDAHHLDRNRHHPAGRHGAQGHAVAAVDIQFGQVEQQVDHPFPAGGAGDQPGARLAEAAQAGQRCEKRGESVGLHG